MKTCERCGTRNATRSLYCQRCGAPFCVTDAESSRPCEDSASDAPETIDLSEVDSPSRPLQKYEQPSRFGTDEKFGKATSEFVTTVGTSLLAIVVAFGRWLFHVFRPVLRATFVFARDRFTRAFSSSSTWDPDWTPNFVFWGILGAFLWKLPTSLIGIVYAVLANDARKEQNYALARRRAESAKNWLIADFMIGLVVCVFKNLVL